jgi:hypothetical protein
MRHVSQTPTRPASPSPTTPFLQTRSRSTSLLGPGPSPNVAPPMLSPTREGKFNLLRRDTGGNKGHRSKASNSSITGMMLPPPSPIVEGPRLTVPSAGLGDPLQRYSFGLPTISPDSGKSVFGLGWSTTGAAGTSGLLSSGSLPQTRGVTGLGDIQIPPYVYEGHHSRTASGSGSSTSLAVSAVSAEEYALADRLERRSSQRSTASGISEVSSRSDDQSRSRSGSGSAIAAAAAARYRKTASMYVTGPTSILPGGPNMGMGMGMGLSSGPEGWSGSGNVPPRRAVSHSHRQPSLDVSGPNGGATRGTVQGAGSNANANANTAEGWKNEKVLYQCACVAEL